jgi:hypothetical protein
LDKKVQIRRIMNKAMSPAGYGWFYLKNPLMFDYFRSTTNVSKNRYLWAISKNMGISSTVIEEKWWVRWTKHFDAESPRK